jgi:hypothetical protein
LQIVGREDADFEKKSVGDVTLAMSHSIIPLSVPVRVVDAGAVANDIIVAAVSAAV